MFDPCFSTHTLVWLLPASADYLCGFATRALRAIFRTQSACFDTTIYHAATYLAFQSSCVRFTLLRLTYTPRFRGRSRLASRSAVGRVPAAFARLREAGLHSSFTGGRISKLRYICLSVARRLRLGYFVNGCVGAQGLRSITSVRGILQTALGGCPNGTPIVIGRIGT